MQLFSFKDSDVGNLQEFEIFIELFYTFVYVSKYDLTSDSRFFRIINELVVSLQT